MFALFCSAAPFVAHAQLKVKTDGNIKIGSASLSPSGGDLTIMESNQTTDARVFVGSANIARVWTMNSLYAYSFGISASGVGQLYKDVNNPSTIMEWNGYGDFGIGRSPSYKLDVNGNLRVNTTIYTSDRNMKLNIVDLSEEKKGSIFDLRGVAYTMKTNQQAIPASGQTMAPDQIMWPEKKIEIRRSYGFIAQEVKEVFPELVYEDKDGILGIDYIGFIPLVFEKVKSQEVELTSLKEKISALEKRISNPTQDGNSGMDTEKGGVLYQNNPNPFKETTTIKFEAAETSQSVTVMILNMTGSLVKKYDVQAGTNEVVIAGRDLGAGMYFYTLIVDNKEVDTKKMILTD